MQASKLILAATVLNGFVAASALAQTQPRDPNMPDSKNVPAEKIDPKGTATTGSTGSGGNLSERLERSEGVITPPAVGDNEIRAPAPVPNPGTMPVITPPGEPGGNQSVQPK